MGQAKRSVIKRPKTANAGAMKKILDANKYDTVVLGDIQKHMLAREDGPRDMTRLHPSEMCKSDWCPRQSYYQLSSDHPEPPEDDHGYVLLNIFDEGHTIHDKWQRRLWDMGMLRGFWKCNNCGHRWEDVSPETCPTCYSPKDCLAYKEIPLRDEEHFIIGHADGDIVLGGAEDDDPLLEIKSIGEGTVRHEYPTLLYEHTHKVEINGSEKSITDLNALWNDIKRPFPSHLRQAMLYLFIKGRTRMVFVYECKWNQQAKEFVVRFNKDLIAGLLDAALDVKYALKVGRPPTRPGWASTDHTTCTKCPYFGTCYEMENDNADDEPGAQASGRGGGEEEAGPPRPDRAAAEADVRRANGSPPARRVVRRRADAALRGADEVD